MSIISVTFCIKQGCLSHCYFIYKVLLYIIFPGTIITNTDIEIMPGDELIFTLEEPVYLDQSKHLPGQLTFVSGLPG